MKKLIVILLAVLSFAVNAKPLIYNSVGFRYTPFIYDVCEDLGINSKIYIVETHLAVRGHLQKQPFGYIIYVNPSEMQPMHIMAHELVHVWQIENGRLDVTKEFYSISKKKYVGKNAISLEAEAEKLGYKLYRKWR